METPSIAELPKHLDDRGRTIWVDLEDPTDEETGVLGGIFGFHILAVEDCIDDAWLPKEDQYDGYSYSIFHAVAPDRQDRLVAQKVDIFVGPNFLVTNHPNEVKGIFDTRGGVAKNPGSLLRSSDWLLHGILNTVIDYCKPAVDGLEARIERLVEAGEDGGQALGDASDVQRDLTTLRSITENQQAALERFAYSESSFVSQENRDYFRDVHDHNRHLHHRAIQGIERLDWALRFVGNSDARRTQSAVRLGVVLLTALMPLLTAIGVLDLDAFALGDQLPPVLIGIVLVYAVAVALVFKQKRWF